MEEEIGKSISELSEKTNGEKALKILYLSAHFSSDHNIYLDMFLCLFKNSEINLDAAVQMLKQKSLIDTKLDEDANKQAFFMKQSVQIETRKFLKQKGMGGDILDEAMDLLSFNFLRDNIFLNYVYHACALTSHLQEYSSTDEKRCNNLGEAFYFAKRGLKFSEKYSAATVIFQHKEATILYARGQCAEAVKMLQGRGKKDSKHSTLDETAKSLISHARKLSQSSEYEKAISLYQILLDNKTVLQTSDSEILTAWQEYAVLLSTTTRHTEAIEILQDVLSQQRSVLIPDDQYGLSTRHIMAGVFKSQGNYIQAMKELEKALEESKKHLGDTHPDTLRAERDIGTLLLHKGDNKESLRRLEDVEKKFKQVFDESHPDILFTRKNIIDALINLKEYKRALRIAEEVYEAYKNIIGEKHSETSTAKAKIGAILVMQGRLNKALEIFREVYRLLPEQHKIGAIKDIIATLELKQCLPTTKILIAAVQNGDFKKIVSLLQNGVNVNKPDSGGLRPLHYAAATGRIDIAKYLLKMGAMYDAEDFKNITPWAFASGGRMKNLFNSINKLFEDVKRGKQMDISGLSEFINIRDKNGYSLLHWAVYNSHKYNVQQLLHAGVEVNSISLKGNTPLHLATSTGNREITEILLQSVTGDDLRALINSKTVEKNNTALHVAVEKNDFYMVKCLLMYGAIYDIQNIDGQTPYQVSNNQSIRRLLIMLQDVFSNVLDGDSEAVTQLKSMNDDDVSIVAKARNNKGHTLMQVAIDNQQENVIHYLLEIL